MKICFPLLGGPGEVYVESRGTKVSWRPHHNREQGKTIMLKNINIFGYLGSRGGGGFNKQTGPILIHIYPFFNINCIPRTKYVRGILWFSRRYAASASASADTSSFSR